MTTHKIDKSGPGPDEPLAVHRAPANPAVASHRAVAAAVLDSPAAADDLTRSAALALDLFGILAEAGVFELAIPLPSSTDDRVDKLSKALAAKTTAAADGPTLDQVAARVRLSTRAQEAARGVLDRDPDASPLARQSALLVRAVSYLIDRDVEVGTTLYRRLDQMADCLNTNTLENQTNAEFGPKLITSDDQKIPAGTYTVTKRVVVDEDGCSRYVDHPGGVPIAGLWPSTLTRIAPVPASELAEEADTDDEVVAALLRVSAGSDGELIQEHELNTAEAQEWRKAFEDGTPFVLRAVDYGVAPGNVLLVRLVHMLSVRHGKWLDAERPVVAESGNGLVTGMVAVGPGMWA